jgi:phosphoribosylformimino-5-aminoimidazole carboxamide ribotide isomerase
MLIIPAIDIIDGKCVRLTRGDFASKKIYSEDPIEVAMGFKAQGANMLHIVDLDGAKTGLPVNKELIVKIKKATNLPVQVGGGIRNLDTIRYYLQAGIDRIIISTIALKNPEYFSDLFRRYGADRLVVSIDVRNGALATDGWLETSEQNLTEFLEELKFRGVREIIVTDILKDGTLTTPNFETIELVNGFGFNVVAAGGISSTESLQKLRNMNIKGAILGKALYEGSIDLKTAIKTVETGSNLTKRIIPCLDVKNGRVVKGINFEDLRDAGDPVELAKYYSQAGADELVLLDIAASKENRKNMLEIVRKVAEEVFIPFTVGGGVTTPSDVRALLLAGADKVSINTAGVLNPGFIQEASGIFGNQCIVVAIDVKKVNEKYKVFIRGGSEETDLDALNWAQQVEKLGAGEILLTSMDRDGTKSGFDLEILKKISESVRIPVIASGGAGSLQDMADAFNIGKADAVLAASLFHYKETSIIEAKKYLKFLNIPIRL